MFSHSPQHTNMSSATSSCSFHRYPHRLLSVVVCAGNAMYPEKIYWRTIHDFPPSVRRWLFRMKTAAAYSPTSRRRLMGCAHASCLVVTLSAWIAWSDTWQHTDENRASQNNFVRLRVGNLLVCYSGKRTLNSLTTPVDRKCTHFAGHHKLVDVREYIYHLANPSSTHLGTSNANLITGA